MNRSLWRMILRILVHLFYRMEIMGAENRPTSGAVLFVSNHLSYSDPVLISACARRSIRFLMWRELHDNPLFEWFFKAMGAIPIASSDTRRQLVASLGEARRSLERGEHIGLFAEGEISRIGQLLPFRKGLQSIAKDLPLSIIPVHLDGLWGSIFSYERGCFFRKTPRQIPYRVRVSFGKSMPSSSTIHEVRQAVMDLGEQAFEQRVKNGPMLHTLFLKRAKKRWKAPCVDGMTAGEMAISAFLLARRWRSEIRGATPVGICMTPSPEFALVNLALAWAGKTVVHLNPALNEQQIREQQLKWNLATIVTSAPSITGFQRSLASLALRWLPAAVTAQSHWEPVFLVPGATPLRFSHDNIQAGRIGLQEVFSLSKRDAMTAHVDISSPLLLIAGLWWPLLAGAQLRYKKTKPDGERISVVKDGEIRFEIRDTTAFVRAEFGGVVCTNTKDIAYGTDLQHGHKDGTFGRPLPGVSVRVVDADTQQLLPPDHPGALQVRTAVRAGEGWLDTGVTGAIDEHGFIRQCNLSVEPSVMIAVGGHSN